MVRGVWVDRDSVHFKGMLGSFWFSLSSLAIREEDRASSLRTGVDSWSDRVWRAKRLLVLLSDELSSGLESEDEDCVGMIGRRGFICMAPLKIFGAKDVGLTGEEESSARARGLKPIFWGMGVNPVYSLGLVDDESEDISLVFSRFVTLLEDESCRED